MHAANEDILSAVVVIIADGNPDIESRSSEASLGGDIREVALAVVLEKPIGELRRGFLQG
jgi:hypothetical protein